MSATAEPETRPGRAPLFFPALLFGVGCTLGLDADARWGTAYLAVGCLMALLLAGWPWVPLRARGPLLIGLLLAAGWWHGCGPRQWSRVDDLRYVVPGVHDPTTAWTGRIASIPTLRTDTAQFEVELETAEQGASKFPVSGRMLVRARRAPAPVPLKYGQEVRLSGVPQAPSAPRNPGQMNYRQYLADHAMDYFLSTEYGELHPGPQIRDWNLIDGADRCRTWARHRLAIGLEADPTVSAILNGMIFGDITDIPDRVAEAFRVTGTFHVFAVSGQNLAELLGLGLFALQTLGLLRWRWGWTLAPVMVFFCLVAENQPSIIRALIMGLFALLAWRLGRPVSSLNLWSVTVWVILIHDPRSIHDLGFLLSFVVVLSLMLAAGPLIRWAQKPWTRDPFIVDRFLPPWTRRAQRWGRSLAALVGTSAAAWLGSAPLMWLCFHQISWVSALANLFVVPLAGLIVVIGTLSILVGMIWPFLTVILNNANWLAVKILLAGVIPMASWPGSSFYAADWRTWTFREGPHVTLADTGGSGPLAVLRYRGQAWVINCGSAHDFQFVVDPLRKFYGINRWDGLLLTSTSNSACGGLPALGSEMTAARCWAPAALPHARKLRQAWEEIGVAAIVGPFCQSIGGDCKLQVWTALADPSRIEAWMIECQGQAFLAAPPGFQPPVASQSTPSVWLQTPGMREGLASTSPAPQAGAQWIVPRVPRYSSGQVPEGPFPPAGVVVWEQERSGALELDWQSDGITVTPFLTNENGKEEGTPPVRIGQPGAATAAPLPRAGQADGRHSHPQSP